LFEIAGGLYWPLELALHTDINYLMVSFEGHNAQMRALFGSSDTPDKMPTRATKGADGKPVVLTPKVFDIQFDRPREIRIKK